MVVQCCVCKQLRVGERWLAHESLEEEASHSYCPTCLEVMKRRIEHEHRLAAPQPAFANA